MKICFFGIYNPEYSRNRILISGLKENNCEVVECRAEAKSGRFLKYFNLCKEYWKIRNRKFDRVIVAFPGQTVVWLARILFGRKIIFDAFTSLYDSEVFDRKNAKEKSLKALYFKFLDRYACKLADKILLDTNEHIKYFVKEFGISGEKFIRVFVGADTAVFYPSAVGDSFRPPGDKFIVHFHGSNIPLQGVEIILGAAKILETEKDISFNIIGTSIKNQYAKRGFKNINFIGNVPYEKLPEHISRADVCLGIFGNTNKARRVIPNKVYEYAAMGKPVITLGTPAVREAFAPGTLRTVKSSDSGELAAAILDCRKNENARRSGFVAAEAISPKSVAKNLLDKIKEVKILVIVPVRKQDYLADTVLDGLFQLRKERNIDFRVSPGLKSRLPHKFKKISGGKLAEFSREADLILFIWGKNSANYPLAEKINQWRKTIFIDGSEPGKNRRFDNEIKRQVLRGEYRGPGAIDYEMLKKSALYFRRERPYARGIKPLPFGIESAYAAWNGKIKKDIDFVCVFGQEEYPPLRKSVREELERYCAENGFKCVTEKTKTPREFYNILARAKAAVSVGGGGFDTARFWEILANNCILLTEKIAIFKKEDNRLNYKSVIEFGDLDEFKSRLRETGRRLKEGYDAKDNMAEFREIMKNHSSKARVEFILKEAEKKGLLS